MTNTPETNYKPAPRPTGIKPFLGPILLVALLALVASLILFAPGDKLGNDRVSWRHVENREQFAADVSRPRLLFFTADWCGPCKILKGTTFADADLAARIDSSFIPMKIDLSDNQSPAHALAQDWKIDAIPALVVVSPGGKEITRSIGVVSTADMNRLLEQIQKLK